MEKTKEKYASQTQKEGKAAGGKGAAGEAAAEEKRGRLAKLLQSTRLKTVLKQLLVAAGGFLLSSISFAAGLSPFALSFAGGAPLDFTIAASIGSAAGAMTGICCGITLGLGEAQPHLLLALPLGGLLAGVCSDYGKWAVAVSFAVSDILGIILKGNADTAFIAVAELICAEAVFLVLPQKALSAASEKLSPLSRDSFAEETRRFMTFTLRKSAKVVRDISSSVNAVTKLLSKSDFPSSKTIPDKVRKDVCSTCARREYCWSVSKTESVRMFGECFSAAVKNQSITPEQLPIKLKTVCTSPERLCEAFTRQLCEYNARIASRNEVFEAKAIAAAQFSSVGGILEDAASSCVRVQQADPRIAALARDALEDEGLIVTSLFAFSDKHAGVCMEVFCTHVPNKPDWSAVLERLFTRTGISFSPPVADEYTAPGTVLSFSEKPKISLKYAMKQHTAAGEEFSGDACEGFYDGKGNYYVVLSDGMGTGTRAALDSVMTCCLMSRLMKAGFSMECALGAVNSAMMVKSADETLATLDILKIDLNSGKTDFYKAGASFSVVRRSGRTAIVEKASLPIGILSETKFEHSETVLSPGDSVLIMSDGTSALAPQFFKDMFHRLKTAEAYDIADDVVKAALACSPGGRSDDITVAYVKLS